MFSSLIPNLFLFFLFIKCTGQSIYLKLRRILNFIFWDENEKKNIFLFQKIEFKIHSGVIHFVLALILHVSFCHYFQINTLYCCMQNI